MASRKTLGIVVVPQCFTNSQTKTWFDFRTFVRTYWELLSTYTLLVSSDTKAILLEISAEFRALGIKVNFIMEDLGNSRTTLNNIANQKAGEIERILLFLDPKDVRNQLEMAPLRMISERGHLVHLNFGAALWAECTSQPAAVRPYPEIRPVESLVFVEENASAPMFDFLARHFGAICLFPEVLVTRGIKSMFDFIFQQRPKPKAGENKKNEKNENEDEENREPVIYVPEMSPDSELTAIGKCIMARSYNWKAFEMHPARGARYHVVTFTDYLNNHAPGPAMQTFYEVCADPRLRVNLLINPQTAVDWIRQYELPKFRTAGAGADG